MSNPVATHYCLLRRLVVLPIVLWLAFLPLGSVVAQTTPTPSDTSQDSTDYEDSIYDEEGDSLDPAEYTPEYLKDQDSRLLVQISLDKLDASTDDGQLEVSPQDASKLRDGQVDVRTTDYLTTLVTPVDQGGYGLGPIKVARIYKNYATKGIGRFDRESTEAIEEDNNIISAHNDGRGVDISEIGQVTCKLVKKRHIGGSTTSWQAPQPVKVAWQSKDGINRFPTPSGDSLIGTAGAMSAQSIVQYLNDSGEMDAYIDYVKGMNFEDIALYVGANIFLKNYAPAQIKNDPLAMSLIEQLGAQRLSKSMPGLPAASFSGPADEDVRLRIAKARLEESLNLPPNSLIGFGWNNILKGTGKRVIERELGLPALYLDTHSLEEMTALETTQAAFEYLGRKDDAFNVINGTIEAIKNKDEKGLVMAGVQALSLAFKVTPAQKAALSKAATTGTEPAVDTSAFPVTSSISLSGLAGLFSEDKAKQKEAALELRQTGLTMLQQAAAKAVPSEYGGITRQLLSDLINKQTFSVGDLALAVGAGQIAAETGLPLNDVLSALKNPRDAKSAKTIADTINEALSLTGTSLLLPSDVQLLFKRGNNVVAQKIAGSEIERAMKWNAGTGLLVFNHKMKFEDAMQESMANAIAEMLGLPSTGYSLSLDTNRMFSGALIESRLGLPKGSITITKDTDTDDILRMIGSKKSLEVFGFDVLEGGKNVFERPSVIAKLKTLDLSLNLPPDTLRHFLNGDVKIDGFDKQLMTANFANITAGKVWDYYDLDEQFRISGEEITTMLAVIRDGSGVTLEQKQGAIQSAYRLLGRTVDAKTNFALDSFMTYFTNPNKREASKVLLDQGLLLFAESMGVNLPDITPEGYRQTIGAIKNIFNGDVSIENDRRELVVLEAKGGQRTTAETIRYTALLNNQALGNYRRGFDQLTNFFFVATGIPAEFRQDAAAFVSGDFKSGLASMSFVLWQKAINPYLPANSGLTYQQLRDTLVFDDETRINNRVDKIIDEGGYKDADQQRGELQNQARRELMEEAKKSTEYKISDGFLRKADPTIPVGFSASLFSANDAERTEILQKWAFNHLDVLLFGADKSYTAGTVEALFKGTADQRQGALIRAIAAKAGLSLGPIGAADMVLYLDYLTSPAGTRNNFYTDPKYGSMWGSLDNWLGQTFGSSELPTGAAKSLYFASQNGWDFNKGLKDAQGNTVIASINSLGENFIVSKISLWGDKTLGLPTGTVFQTYRAISLVADASRALRAAQAIGDAAKIAQSSKALSAAQASLTVLVITTALNACSVCQQIFSTVDQAIAAPPGFTNAAVAGAIAMAFGLGPAGLYIAAAIYLFGIYKVDYLCPVPPKDPYSLTAYDKDYDQLNYGYPYDPLSGAVVKSSPPPGANPFDWDNDVPFADGKDPQLWMAWSRYFTGLVLDKTLDYSAAQNGRNQARQVITLRQANVEFFADRATAAFGEAERDNPRMGMGYTQDSTKTTDWVHVAFGGLF